MFSRKESVKRGMAQRDHVGRSAFKDIAPRRFDPLDTLRVACEGHVMKLLPEKFKRMSLSPFAFFRGAVEIMAADLAEQKHTRLEAQLCGDAHLKNFGFFATPGADILIDINDFDQTTRGPWEWDVKRMATSIVLAGRVAGDGDARAKQAANVVLEE